MASSGNICILNPVHASGTGTPNFGALSEGNTVAELEDTAFGSVGVTSGKWYWEFVVTSSSPSGQCLGWANSEVNSTPELGYNSPSSPSAAQIVYMYLDKNPPEIISDSPKSESSGSDADYGSVIGQNDIVGVAGDFDNDKWYFSINGSFTDMRSGQNPSTGANPMCSATGGGGLVTIARTAGFTWFPAIGSWSAPTRTIKVNFGQDSTFSGSFSAGGNADENGFGDFKYSVPSGFLTMCSANLPISDDIDPGGDDGETENPTKHFNVVTYTGNANTGQSITGLGFKPDLVWAKMSSSSQNNQLYDSSRLNDRGTPTPFMLRSDTTGTQADDQTEGNGNPIIASFDNDGFTLGTSGSGPNDSGRTYVAWCWRANGGTTSTNTSGTANSTVQANTKAGFSISLTDNYTAANGVTIGHGLGKKPAFYIHKPTGNNSSGGASQAFNWHVYHHSLGATKALFLNLNNAAATAIGYWNNTEPTSTVLSLGNLIAGNGQSLVYAWSEIEGYSKFGLYTGNGNADGTFIYTGFRPRMIFIKRSSTTGGWWIFDTARDTFNVVDKYVGWHSNGAESSGSNFDFLANGFKIRNSDGDFNGSGTTIVYGAWADVPFKYHNPL